MSFRKIFVDLFNSRNNDEDKESKNDSFLNHRLNQIDYIIKELSKFEKFELVEQSEFKSIKNKNKIKLFNCWNAVVEQTKEFCGIWIQKENLRAEYDCANTILSAYYENGQILDYLERINRYISDLTDDEDPVIASQACYNNYIYFLMHFMEKLKERKRTLNTTQSEGVSHDSKTTKWIIDHECNGLNGVKKLQEKVHTARVLHKKIIQKSYTRSDEDSYSKLTGFINDEYKGGATGCEALLEEDVAQLKAQTLQVKEQISNMKCEIQNAEELYNSLIAVLSTEWFEHFKPIESGDGTEKCVELKDRLSQAMSEANEKILNVYTRK